MEMNDDGIEHQATVDKGLKMKIKRKQSAAASGSKAPPTTITTSETKTKSVLDEINKVSKNSTTVVVSTTTTVASMELVGDGGVDSKQPVVEDDAGSAAGSDGGPVAAPSRFQKRKQRNNKNGKSREVVDSGSAVDKMPSSENENRVIIGRDLCQFSRNKDAIGSPLERSSNRKRSALDLGIDARDQTATQQLQYIDDNKELVNKIGNKSSSVVEYGCSTLSGSSAASERSDFTTSCLSEAAAAAAAVADNSEKSASLSADPYEFILRMEDLPQIPAKKFKSEKMDSEMMMSSSSSSSTSSRMKRDAGTVTYNVGVMTDPDCLGACEPGTHVVLEGIVWCESNNGILVVNVTWRGKTYVGTLMDATKHHWASPRFREESPSAELDYRVQKAKRGTPVTDIAEGRRLRKCRRTTATSNNGHSGNGATKTMVTRQSPPINSESNGRQRGGGGARASEHLLEAAASGGELPHPMKKTKLDLDATDESFFKCIAPDCSKKFKHISGLRYHQSHAHKKQAYVWMPKPETAANSDLAAAAQDKCRNVKKNDETSAKMSNGAVLESIGQDPDQQVGILSTAGCDLMESGESVLKQGSETVVVKTEVNFPLPEEMTKTNDVHEQILTSSDACIPSPQWPAVSVVTGLAVASESMATLVMESSTELPQHSAMDDLKRMAETGKTSEPSQSQSTPLVATSFHSAVKSVAELAKSDSKTDSPGSSNTLSDLTDKTRNRPIEIDADIPNRADVSSSPAVVDIFHKPILRTPEVGKHRTIHQTSSEKCSAGTRMENGGQPMAILRPQNIGLKLLPPGDCNSDDKSPAYSDISDANDGAFSESEMRQRKADKELKRAQKAEKPSSVRKYDDFSSSSGLQPSSSYKHSPFPMPVTASPSSLTSLPDGLARKPTERVVKPPRDGEPDQGRRPLGMTPSSKTGAVGAKPMTPVSEQRQRTEKSNQASDFNMEILQAQENGRLWMEMIQRSSMSAANMMPYGYAVDPLAHMQLMTSNREYREHYERWYMGQQCYRQLLQAESDRCSVGGDKPVDMSAKSVSSVATSASDSAPFYAKSKSNMKLPSRPSGGGGVEEHMLSSERHRGDSLGPTQNCSSDFGGKGVVYNHHEKTASSSSSSSRDKLHVSLKQEPGVRQRVSEKDEKLVDLMHNTPSNINKVKTKQLDERVSNFGVSSSPGAVSKPKSAGLTNPNMSAHPSNQMQDYPKTSLPQMRYDTNYASFAAYGNPPYMDSSSLPVSSGPTPSASAGMTSRYQDLNSKYPPSLGSSHDKSIPGHSPSVAPARKSGQLATPLSSKELSPTAEKSESSRRQQPVDGFDFAANEGSMHDKPSTSSSSGHGSPLTLRHLHTHHHTHLVGPYPLYGSYSGLMSPVPTIVPPVVPVIPPTYIPK